MPQQSASYNWIVPLVAILVIIGVALGLALSNTNLLNFNTSAADMRAKDQATQAQAAKAELDRQVYEAQKQVEIATIAANARAQADKAMIDQQIYRIQQTAEALKQIAAAKQQEARQLTQAEVERRGLLAQVEIQREQQLAQIRAANQQRSEQTVLTLTLAVMMVLITVAITVGGLGFGIFWLRRRQAQPVSIASTSNAQHDAKQSSKSATNRQAEQQYWLRKRIEARANEIALLKQLQHAQSSPDSVSVEYYNLPLAS